MGHPVRGRTYAAGQEHRASDYGRVSWGDGQGGGNGPFVAPLSKRGRGGSSVCALDLVCALQRRALLAAAVLPAAAAAACCLLLLGTALRCCRLLLTDSADCVTAAPLPACCLHYGTRLVQLYLSTS